MQQNWSNSKGKGKKNHPVVMPPNHCRSKEQVAILEKDLKQQNMGTSDNLTDAIEVSNSIHHCSNTGLKFHYNHNETLLINMIKLPLPQL